MKVEYYGPLFAILSPFFSSVATIFKSVAAIIIITSFLIIKEHLGEVKSSSLA
jgi:hypothetical protein